MRSLLLALVARVLYVWIREYLREQNKPEREQQKNSTDNE